MMSAEQSSRLVLFATFLIWVAFGFLTGFGLWAEGVAFGLAASLCLMAILITRKLTVKVMDWTLLSYFVLAGSATFFFSTRFPTYSQVAVWLFYATAAWGSIAVGRPFTLQYARESAPAEDWENPAFWRANPLISVVWALAFLTNLALVIVALNPRYHSLWIAAVTPILTMIAASIFTTFYTKMVRARRE
jgi:hypothetical protein